MEKKMMTLEEMYVTHAAVNSILRVPGLGIKKVYWLDKLRKQIEKHLRAFEINRESLVEEYAVTIPPTPIVPALEYPRFKEDLLNAWVNGEDVRGVLEKYEKISDHAGQKGVEIHQRKEFEVAMQALAQSCSREIEYAELVFDHVVEQVLSQLPGDLQLAIMFVFNKDIKEPDIIVVPSSQGPFLI